MTRGKFIVLEGGEGCGKSTQAQRLAESLGALRTREPGGTAVGAQLREVLLGRDTTGLADRAEALLMAADRAQHVAEVIEPALASGQHVVCDRFLGSSVAYQGYGRGLGPAEVRDLSIWATGGLFPDLVVLLTVPAEESDRRTGGARDRIEDAGREFHQRVAEGFAEQAAADPDRWVVVDGSGTKDEVAAAIGLVVAERLGLAP